MPDDLSTGVQNHLGSHGIFDLVVIIALGTAGCLIVLHLIMGLLGGRAEERRVPWTWWERLLYLATVLCIGTLGVTAFYSILGLGSLKGWWLLVHMVGAGTLTALLPILALTWYIPNLFVADENDDNVRQRSASALRSWVTDIDTIFSPRFFWMPKVLFWIIVASGLVVTLTMLVSMLPIFGTDGLLMLLEIHRYAGLVAVVAMALHLNCVILQRLGLR